MSGKLLKQPPERAGVHPAINASHGSNMSISDTWRFARFADVAVSAPAWKKYDTFFCQLSIGPVEVSSGGCLKQVVGIVARR